MKRLCLYILLSALVAPALATTNYINSGNVVVVSPPEIAPQIDASNFVNYGTFYITNTYPNGVLPPNPYQSWNTRNWTNANRMAGDTGFRFDYFDSVGQTNGPSANFYNAANANPTNATIFGNVYLRVSATNINNKGTLLVGSQGMMTLKGEHLDLARGVFAVGANETNSLAGVTDVYWGTNEANAVFYDGSTVQSPYVPVTTIIYPQAGMPMYAYLFQSLLFTNACGTNLLCTNGFTAYITTNQVFYRNAVHSSFDILFLRQTNPAVVTDVRYGNAAGPGRQKVIQWQAGPTNRANGSISSHGLFLSDTFGFWAQPPLLLLTPEPNPLSAARYRPINYNITHVAPAGFDVMPSIPPTLVDPLVFSGTNFPTVSTNVAWAADLTAAAFPPDPTIQWASWTNVPGRIELTASGPGSYLDLTRTLMNAQSYLLLSATNHFIGSSNAVITAPVTDIYLGSTNGVMMISNLTSPFYPQMEGEIRVWSGRWTNVTAQGLGTLYTVTMVDSDLNPAPASQVRNFQLRSTNVFIADVVNVFNNLLIDAERLTISTNAGNAPTAYGELNLTSSNLWWSASFPTLQYVTNFGRISSLTPVFFAGSRTPPWFSGTFDEPYQSFVTHGTISTVGASIWANYFEASGTNDSSIGPLTVEAETAIITNGAFFATDQDITLTTGSLLISNQVLAAGRSIVLTVTNFLDDGSLTTSVDLITNKNIWTAGGGIDLPFLPTNGASLLGTTVTNTAVANAEVDNVWAGTDFGASPVGFANNAALGQLILDGQDPGSIFTFFHLGATNALYVDLLQLKDATANADGMGNFVGVFLQTNFTIYYGDAVYNGQSIAEQLNGRYGFPGTMYNVRYDFSAPSGGRFVWVSNYNTGFFSSTNVTYSDGSVHRLNRALVTSCTIDSNGNGIPNCMDTNPVPVTTSAMLDLQAVFTSKPVRSVVLSWKTLPLASNYLYGSWTLPPGTNWQLLTQFMSPATVTRVTMTNAIQGSGPLYYRVGVLSP